MAAVTPGVRGYAAEAGQLVKRYESIPFACKHRDVLHLIPTASCRVLDIGAGTGCDASWLADKGHRLVAVEPTDELRLPGMALHPSPLIEWLDDSLPNLAVVMSKAQRFDLIMLTAVWMHLDRQERQLAMPNVASLLTGDGVLLMSLRHGPPPTRRRMFEVSADETIQLARGHGLQAVLCVRTPSAQAVNRQAGVEWSQLAFVRARCTI